MSSSRKGGTSSDWRKVAYMQLHRYLLPVAVPLLVGKVCTASTSGDSTAHSWGRLVQEMSWDVQ